MNPLTVYDDRYIKTKIRMYGDNIYTNFCCFNVAEDGVECKSFYENKYYLQVYLDNCTFKIINTEMIDYLDGNVFKTD